VRPVGNQGRSLLAQRTSQRDQRFGLPGLPTLSYELLCQGRDLWPDGSDISQCGQTRFGQLAVAVERIGLSDQQHVFIAMDRPERVGRDVHVFDGPQPPADGESGTDAQAHAKQQGDRREPITRSKTGMWGLDHGAPLGAER